MSNLKSVMSEKLYQFYCEYLAWLNTGALEGLPFTRCGGLCSNLYNWPAAPTWPVDGLFVELQEQFREAGLSVTYPFGKEEYENSRYSQHLDQKRIAWVRRHAA